MLTLSTAGKSEKEAVKIVRDSVSNSSENELKILIDGPLHAEVIKDYLVTQGFDNILPEDDDGALYLVATRSQTPDEPEPEASQPEQEAETVDDKEKPDDFKILQSEEIPQKNPEPEQIIQTIPSTTGILISCEPGKTNQAFCKNFLASLVNAEHKPDVIALINNAVKLAAYNSQTCDFLKELEADGVKIYISESCADRLSMTGAVGVGVILDMSEIFDEIFVCGKVISV